MLDGGAKRFYMGHGGPWKPPNHATCAQAFGHQADACPPAAAISLALKRLRQQSSPQEIEP